MRFAFVSTMTGLAWGGSEELWSQTAIQLKRDGHDVRALVAHHTRLSHKVTSLAKQGIEIDTFGRQPHALIDRIFTRLTRGRQKAYNRLKRFKPDLVVISQGHNSGGFNWANVCREASITYTLIVHCNSESMWFADTVIEEAVEVYKAAQKVFCVSLGNLSLLRMQLGDPIPNSEVIWNPYNVSPETIPSWPAEDGVWKMACVARMEPSAKGQDLLLQVFARPEWRARPVELSLFGDGPFALTLRRLADMLQLNHVHFRGHVSGIEAIWQQNHILVLPSRYEGLPLVLVESMWCGRPAVVTDVAGNTEVCVDNETGFVAPAPTVDSLAQALERAWERREDWQRMGQGARARAESIIPKNPISAFAENLKRCMVTAREIRSSANPGPAKTPHAVQE